MTTEIQNNRYSSTTENASLASLRRQRTIDANNQQSSFYEELLNLPFFDATEPPAPTLPPANTSNKSSSDETGPSEKGDAEGEDSSSDEPVTQVAAVQVTPKAFEEIPVRQETETERPKIKSVTGDESKEHSRGNHDHSTANNAVKGREQTKQTTNTDTAQSPIGPQLAKGTPEQTTAPELQLQKPTVEAKQATPVTAKAKSNDNQATDTSDVNSTELPTTTFKGNAKTDSKDSVIAAETAVKPVENNNRGAIYEAKKSNTNTNEDSGKSLKEEQNLDAQPVVNRRAVRLAERREQSRDDRDNNDSTGQDRVVAETKDSFASGLQADKYSQASAVVASIDINAVNGAQTSSVGALPDSSATAIAAAASATTSVTPTSDIASSVDKKAGAEIGVTASTSSSNASSAGVPAGTSVTSNLSGTAKAAEGARGSSGSPLSPYQQSKLVQRVLRGIEQLSNGGGQVRLRLHPPELGALQMTLKISDGQMSAQMEVENSLAKDALLSNVHTLKEKLSEQGITIDKFDVQIANSTANGSASGSAFGNGTTSDGSWRDQPTSRYVDQNNNRLSDDNSTSREVSRSWTRTNGNLDVRV